jgi:hypothetical protein
VVILKGVKVICFDTVLEVLILKGLTLHKNSAKKEHFGRASRSLKEKREPFGAQGKQAPPLHAKLSTEVSISDIMDLSRAIVENFPEPRPGQAYGEPRVSGCR